MSILDATRSGAAKTKIAPLTNEIGDHHRWKAQLQRYMFELFFNVNMDELKQCTTLDANFFGALPALSAECKIYKAWCKDEDQEPFT